MLNPNLADLSGHGVAEPPASASHALLESALDVLVDHTFGTNEGPTRCRRSGARSKTC